MKDKKMREIEQAIAAHLNSVDGKGSGSEVISPSRRMSAQKALIKKVLPVDRDPYDRTASRLKKKA